MAKRRFEGQRAIITGGGSGIGRALALRLADEGAAVLVAGRRADKLEETAAMRPSAISTKTADVTSREDVGALVDAARDALGGLDIYVSNAGVGYGGEVRDTTYDDWRRMIDVNLWSVIHGVDAAYPVFLDQGHGLLVNVASSAGLMPRAGMAPYSMVKSAVNALTLAHGVEARRHGVDVMLACPGPVQTDILDATTFRGFDGSRIADFAQGKQLSATECAARIIDAMHRRAPYVLTNADSRAEWLLHRLSPRLGLAATRARFAMMERIGK